MAWSDEATKQSANAGAKKCPAMDVFIDPNGGPYIHQ
jgi:hypothetical protein